MPVYSSESFDFVSRSPDQTRRIGARLGALLRSGDVLALSGDLGAGKTQLVRGLARGLGVTTRVHSPTFTLVNEYSGGRLKLFHLDLYRLETPDQIHSAGIEEFLQPDGVAVIEWAERLENGRWKVEDGKFRKVTIEVISETERRIIYEDSGA